MYVLNPLQILGIVLGCAVFALVLAGIVCLALNHISQRRDLNRRQAIMDGDGGLVFKKFRQDGSFRNDSGRNSSQLKDIYKLPVNTVGSDDSDFLPRALAYVDLLRATKNFDEQNIVGGGGFGVVYKAKLVDGSVVAIKKLIQEGAQGDREFAAEMLALGNVRHDNLVPLLGYCAFAREKLLVYKFMTHGSLEEWLHDRPQGKAVLNWPRRVHIAVGAARGLAFLHTGSPVILHRDMKASNILLNDDFSACVTDFGLAREMCDLDTHVSTVIAGTLGYVPPEYSQTWRSTTKGDVYSFGVVLLELVTGRRPTGPDFDDPCDDGTYSGGNLVEWVRILVAKKRGVEALDPTILKSPARDHESQHDAQLDSQEELYMLQLQLKVLKLAVACTSDIPGARPAMSQVSEALDRLHLELSEMFGSQADL